MKMICPDRGKPGVNCYSCAQSSEHDLNQSGTCLDTDFTGNCPKCIPVHNRLDKLKRMIADANSPDVV